VVGVLGLVGGVTFEENGVVMSRWVVWLILGSGSVDNY